MLEANKIFTPNFSFPQKRAEIKANLGLNELQYENYDNAILYLNEALDIAKTNNLTTTSSNIINWLALINLIQHKEDNALKILKKSDKTEPCPKHTLLFRHEMFARIYKQQNKLTSSLKHINQALDIATKLKNEREIFELNYLKAEIYFMKNNFLKSTQILNQLITQKHSPNAPYFKANAYTLLGLIAFEKNNFQRAKNLFNISLNLENSKSRTKAIAIDYNNLAEVSLKQKNIHQTLEYLNKALKNAQEINDAELISYLNQKISTLS